MATYPTAAEPASLGGAGAPRESEHVRWAQDCLNRTMSLRLPVDGILTTATRSAVRGFQQKENLPVTGILGPDTEQALQRSCSGPASPPSDSGPNDQEQTFESEGFGDVFRGIATGIGGIATKAAGLLGGSAGSSIIDLTSKADKTIRKGMRNPKSVDALVLHQMACCFKPRDPLSRFLSLKAHFAILADGRILQLHPIAALIWASNRFNARSVAVEFAGNFPDAKGKWWQGDIYGENQLTSAQVEGGRQLVRHLMKTMGLTQVFAHRQSSGTRDNDPGPDIWYHVGQWAVARLGLKDGGPGFKLDSGTPIPEAWRTWKGSPVSPELALALEDESTETELVHDVS